MWSWFHLWKIQRVLFLENVNSFLPGKNRVSHVTRFFPGTYRFHLSNAQVFLFFSFLILKSLFNNFLVENMSTCILSVFINTTFFNWASTFENNCGDAYQLSKWIFKILEGAMKNTKGTQYFSINFGNLRFLEIGKIVYVSVLRSLQWVQLI